MSFHTTTEIENGLPEPIRVTPVAIPDGGGPKDRTLIIPMYAIDSPFIHPPAVRHGDFLLYPGERVVIPYDWDDYKMSELVVETSHGGTFQLVVDSSDGCCSPGPDKILVMPTDLRPVQPHVASAAHGTFFWPVLLVWAAFFAPVGLVTMFVVDGLRARRASARL